MPLPPYQRPMYDDRGSTARMSDLILRRGQIQADLALRQGDTSARLAQNLGSIASGTMADLVSLAEKRKAQERQARLDDEAAQDRAQRRELVGRQIQQADDAMATQATKAREERSFHTILGRLGTREGGLNWDEAEKEFAAQGMTHLIPRVREYRGRLEKEAAELQAARLRAAQQEGLILGLTVDTLKATGGDKDPTGFALGLGALTDAKVLSQGQALRYWQQVEDEAQGDSAKASAAIQRIVREAEQAAAPFRKAEPPKAPTIRTAGRSVVSVDPTGTKATVLYTDPVREGRDSGGDGAPKPLTNAQRIAANNTYQRDLGNAEEAARQAIARERERILRAAPDTDLDTDPTFRAFKEDIYTKLEQDKATAQRAYRENIQWTPGPHNQGRDMANRPERDMTSARPQPAPADPRQAPPPQSMQALEAQAQSLMAQYRREMDPTRKEQLKQELLALRRQATGR